MNNKAKKKQLKVTNLPQNKGYVPGIRIQGNYLLNLGFQLGDIVEITPRNDGSLNLTKVKEVGDEAGK